MRSAQSLLLSLAIALTCTGCVMVLGFDGHPEKSKIVVIDDDVYVVDKEAKTLRLIHEGDEPADK